MTQHVEPCPFCGGNDQFSERSDFSSSYVVCNDCGARGPTECQESDDEDEPGREAAYKAWNRRTPSDDVGRMPTFRDGVTWVIGFMELERRFPTEDDIVRARVALSRATP